MWCKVRKVKRNLFVISAFATTDLGSNTQKDQFYEGRDTLVCRNKGIDIIKPPGEFDKGRTFIASTACLSRSCILSTQRTNNEDKFIEFCTDNCFIPPPA